MFGLLPDLTPRDRSQLARLRADEHNLDRRRLNVQNFGSTWLKPPGVPKTLHQMREERREAEEHAEAVRREQLQQELAEAEEGGGPEEDDETADMEDLGDGARDLDEEIPDADAVGMELTQRGDGDDDDDDGPRAGDGPGRGEALREERRAELVQARMRMARGGDDDVYGADEEEIEAETEGQLLLEDEGDSFLPVDGQVADEDLDMDADLDGSMADGAELSGVYEHTDTEAELSSSLPSDSSDAEDEDDVGFAPRSSLGAGVLRPPTSPTMQGRGQTHHPRQDMDLSSLLSGGDSSMGSSPQAGAAPQR
ncbi:Apc15p protein-domain-containing protein [Verticillium dahliae]|nr:Apc15p protein-domain-containing protein [Verticillium dahliae]